MNRRDAAALQQAINIRLKGTKILVEKSLPKVSNTGLSAGEYTFGTEDDTPQVTKFQRAYTELACREAFKQGLITEVPSIPKDLQIGTAVEILKALGSDPEKLFKAGRTLGASKELKAWMADR